MKQIKPYIMYSGRCKEALLFYRECFNGEIVLMQTYAESNMNLPEKYNERIFNSEFKADGIDFMASDDLPDNQVKAGSNFALFVIFENINEQKESFNKLAKDGNVLFPLENNFGMVVDKFGIQWMLTGKK